MNWGGPPGGPVFTCEATYLVIAAPAAPLNRLLSLRPVVWLGSISYGIYVFFIPVIILVDVYFSRFHWANLTVVLTVQVVGTLTMATLSYYLVERRFLGLKAKLNDRPPRHKPQHARSRFGGNQLGLDGLGVNSARSISSAASKTEISSGFRDDQEW